ncbi:hypothetical protein DVH24_030973 [Malus domestica]|uniref:Serine-threonine/tyrosine-protein kinase catalytic domain-containing protein n=1 Tax=Malus domestica TaxID=3750 RepID=A0A498HD00_MALDO|nr:hypothetical protein DVH24_030973 [Malus domestica]
MSFTLRGKEDDDGFLKLVGFKVPDSHEFVSLDSDSTSADCKTVRLNNCSYKAYALVYKIGCLIWSKHLTHMQEFPSDGVDVYIHQTCIELADELMILVLDAFFFWFKSKGKPIKLIASLTCSLCIFAKSGHIKLTRKHIKITRDTLQEYIGGKHDLSELMIYDFDSILVATDNFSIENKLGQGGFGPVYWYAMGGIFSQKSDVYSFGVFVLEIISSKKNTAFYIYDRQLGLLAYAWQLWKEGRELELVDEMLAAESYSASEVMKYVHIGLLCVQDNAMDRPSMQDVVFMLNGSTTVIGGAQPKQPLFTIQNTVSHPQPQPSNTFLTNEATTTLIEGR